MNRSERGVQLVTDVRTSPLLDKSPGSFQALVWFAAGEVAVQEKRLEDARKHFTKVSATKAPLAQAARSQIAKL